MRFLRWLRSRFPPSEPGPEDESVWARAKRDTNRVNGSWVARGIVGALDIALAVYVAEILAGANKASVSVGVLTVVALAGGTFVAVGIVYATQIALAPIRQRNEARSIAPLLRVQYENRMEAIERARTANEESYRESFDRKSAETEDLRGQLGAALARVAELETFGTLDEAARLAASKLQLGTELRDIRHKIEIVKSTRPHPHYSDPFRLPAARWDEYDEVLAADPELYRTVERAYTASHHVNEAVQMRRTRAKPGQTLGVIGEDGLDAAYEAAGLALDALGEDRGDVWESGVGRATREVTEVLLDDYEFNRKKIVELLVAAIEQGQGLFERRVDTPEAWNRWLSDHGEWRDLVNGKEGALKAMLPVVDHQRVNDMSELPDSVPVGEFDYNADHARSRVYIDRRVKNLVAVLSDYRESP